MQARQRVAVVEDDPEIREVIVLPVLQDAGFEAVGMQSALALYRALVSTRFDAVLLDAELPDEDGFAIARYLRAHAHAPRMVMLTRDGSEAARRLGEEAGAVACIAKPIDLGTLVDTVRTVLQKAAAGRWSLDARGWRLRTPDGASVALSLQEHQVMQVLAATPGVPVRRETLIACLADDVQGFDPHRLETLVYRLRRKCAGFAGVPLPLRSVRSIGYVLTW